jgi:hypothetical protein
MTIPRMLCSRTKDSGVTPRLPWKAGLLGLS